MTNVSTLEIGDFSAFPHNSVAIVNNFPGTIRHNWGGVINDVATGTSTFQNYGTSWGYEEFILSWWPNGNETVMTTQSWWHTNPFTTIVDRQVHSAFTTNSTHPNIAGIRFIHNLPASITPHMAGTVDVPGLPIHPIVIEQDNIPFLVSSGTFHHVVFRVDPAVESLTDGVKLRLGRLDENGQTLPPQSGIDLYQDASGQPLSLDANGDILLTPTQNSELFDSLVSEEGLRLLLRTEASVDSHQMQLRFLSQTQQGLETIATQVKILPVQLTSDLNNDGQITATDNPLRDAACASDVTEAIRDDGTEFIFHNDKLSNGIWDKEDSDSTKPANEQDDDDAEKILIKPGIEEGEIWLDHPAIAGLSFYKTRECNAADKVNLSPTNRFRVSPSNPFPDELFMRVDGTLTYPEANPQREGDLVLKIRVGVTGQEVEAAKMKLTVVKAVGAKKYFNTARDYMFENNSKICVRMEKVGLDTNPYYKRIISMIHEKTEMKAVDSFRRNPKLYGIDSVKAEFSVYDIIVNGNFCFYSGFLKRPPKNSMTDKCHGRLISSGVQQPSSSTGGSSIFESAIADFIGWNSQTGINIETGIVPISPMTYSEALGGFGSNIKEEGNSHPWFGIANSGNHKIFFVVTPSSELGSANGGGLDLRNRLQKSGCPPLPGGQPDEIQCVYGDGGSSLGLAYKITNSTISTRVKGGKHFLSTRIAPHQGDYFINTYLAFKSQNPR